MDNKFPVLRLGSLDIYHAVSMEKTEDGNPFLIIWIKTIDHEIKDWVIVPLKGSQYESATFFKELYNELHPSKKMSLEVQQEVQNRISEERSQGKLAFELPDSLATALVKFSKLFDDSLPISKIFQKFPIPNDDMMKYKVVSSKEYFESRIFVVEEENQCKHIIAIKKETLEKMQKDAEKFKKRMAEAKREKQSYDYSPEPRKRSIFFN
eukprot:GHVP01046957.1.p1 GENE.GHVP01046957.1~~GHVP01046957.1.p1  ORF type:complete len:237 (-),score=45.49 GHVP01046957.1:142-768(-)